MILPTEVPSNRTAATASRYIQTGLLFLVGAAAVILLHLPELMAAPRHNPVTLVLAHLFFLGFGTLITFGVLGQMIQVITGQPIEAGHHKETAYALLVPGILVQTAGFAVWMPWVITVGGALVVAGTFLFAVPFLAPLAKHRRNDRTALFILFALFFLMGTVLFGLLMALQLEKVWSSWLFLNGFIAHMLLGGLGMVHRHHHRRLLQADPHVHHQRQPAGRAGAPGLPALQRRARHPPHRRRPLLALRGAPGSGRRAGRHRPLRARCPDHAPAAAPEAPGGRHAAEPARRRPLGPGHPSLRRPVGRVGGGRPLGGHGGRPAAPGGSGDALRAGLDRQHDRRDAGQDRPHAGLAPGLCGPGG